MLSHNDDRVYSKEGACCLLKKKLQIPKTAPVFKEFFDLFFYHTGGVYYSLMDDNQIDNFFEKIRLLKQTSVFLK